MRATIRPDFQVASPDRRSVIAIDESDEPIRIAADNSSKLFAGL
jgi:hypothetical protein